MRKLHCILLLFCAVPTPAFAEHLNFDHRLHPPLKAVFDQKRDEMITYDNSNPRYVIDRIAITGKSASDWTEALDIVVRVPAGNVKTADDWFAEIKSKTGKACPSAFAVITTDPLGMTFSRRSTNCGADKVQFALYRIVTGTKSLFLLNAIHRADMDEQTQRQWLALLGSAQLAN
jgi:hypothetical protein